MLCHWKSIVLMTFSFLLCFAAFSAKKVETANKTQDASPLYLSRKINWPIELHYTKGIEGPAADRNGKLYATNFMRSGTIGIQSTADEQTSPTTWWTLPHGGKSASILIRSSEDILIADYTKHIIYKIKKPTAKPEIFFQSNEMNQPNDMTMTADGTLYLSDPSWNSRKPGHIWKISQTGSATKIMTQAKAANGIDLSPDEKILYYTESIQGKLYACDLFLLQKAKAPGTPKDCKLLIQFPPDTVDGIKTDLDGNIYIARIQQGKIDKYSPSGVLEKSIVLQGKSPTNLAFGGVDGKSVFVTIRDDGSIEKFQTPIAGRVWSLQK